MDSLGDRIERDTNAIKSMRHRANELELEAIKLRREAGEMERLLEKFADRRGDQSWPDRFKK